MTGDILLTLAVALGALVLFVWGPVRMDVVGIIVMTALILLGVLPPEEAIRGFANEATITVALMLALSTGLLRTGAIDLLRRHMTRLAGESEFRLLLVIIAVILPVSAFISNTAAVAVLLPVVMGLSRQIGAAPSRFLMPLSFAGQLGGTLTLIGTSTNLLVAGLVFDLGVDRIDLFEITPPALVMAAVGVIYLLTVGRLLTPARDTSDDLLESFELREYVTGLTVGANSPLNGSSLREARFEESYGLQVVELDRDGRRIRSPGGEVRLRTGDLLLVAGTTEDVARTAEETGLTLAGGPPDLSLDEDDENRLVEVLVPPHSRAHGRTLRGLRFRARTGVHALAIQRRGARLDRPVGDVALSPGDLLLVSGPEHCIEGLHEDPDFVLLGAVELPARRTRKIAVAVGILASVVLLPAFDVLPILVSALLGVIAMFVLGVMTPAEAANEMDWMVIILLGSILSLGFAMQETGTAAYLGDRLVGLTRSWGPYGTLAAVYLGTSLLTELISNNGAAVVLTPIAVATAEVLGISPMPLVVAVMFAASNSFMTPVGYQTNTFIYGPGGYRFTDYVRVGGLLNLLLATVATFVIPVFFPF